MVRAAWNWMTQTARLCNNAAICLFHIKSGNNRLTGLSDVRCSSLLWISFTLSASSPTSSYVPLSSPLTTLLQWCSWVCFISTTSTLKQIHNIITNHLRQKFNLNASTLFQLVGQVKLLKSFNDVQLGENQFRLTSLVKVFHQLLVQTWLKFPKQ